MSLLTMAAVSIVIGSMVGAINFITSKDKICSIFIGFITSLVLLGVGLLIYDKPINQDPRVDPTLTKFLNFEPVQMREINWLNSNGPGHDIWIKNEALDRKMDKQELRQILNVETYLIRLPPGATLKVTLPDRPVPTKAKPASPTKIIRSGWT